MEKKRQKKWTIAKVLLIMAFLFPVAGTNVASAGNLGDSAYYATVANIYQGYSQYYGALAILNGSNTYQYYAYEYMYNARLYMDDAWYYAGWASGDYAYYAYIYADDAYYLYYDAEDYAWAAYYYGSTTYSLYALYLGGLGSQYGVIAEYYAAIGSNGGYY